MVPLGGDAALWNLGVDGGYTVSFVGNVGTDSATIKHDTVTFDLNGFTYGTSGVNATHSLVVGLDDGDVGHLTLVNGRFSGATARVATSMAAQGTLVVGMGGDLDLRGEVILGGGQAVLRAETGGRIRLRDRLAIGAQARVELAGGGVSLNEDGILPGFLRVGGDGVLDGDGVVVGNVESRGTLM